MAQMDEIKESLQNDFNAMPLGRRMELLKGDDVHQCIISFMKQKNILQKICDFILKLINQALSLVTDKKLTVGASDEQKKSWTESVIASRALNEIHESKKTR